MSNHHEIAITAPLYNQRVRQTVCSCGWASEELPTAGKATIAGWEHIRAARQSVPPTTNPSISETHPAECVVTVSSPDTRQEAL